jgi:hypothetical protein
MAKKDTGAGAITRAKALEKSVSSIVKKVQDNQRKRRKLFGLRFR